MKSSRLFSECYIFVFLTSEKPNIGRKNARFLGETPIGVEYIWLKLATNIKFRWNFS